MGNDDPRSVHFLGFPEVKTEYLDADIERQVKRMQSVIELTRQLRERHTLMLKVRSRARERPFRQSSKTSDFRFL